MRRNFTYNKIRKPAVQKRAGGYSLYQRIAPGISCFYWAAFKFALFRLTKTNHFLKQKRNRYK